MKKFYKNPTFRQVKSGKILPIYEDYKDQKNLLGYAKLNNQVKSTLPILPYIRTEIGESPNRDPHCIIWSWKRYNITYVDPWEYDEKIPEEERKKYMSRVGFTTNWNIAFYLRTSSIMKN